MKISPDWYVKPSQPVFNKNPRQNGNAFSFEHYNTIIIPSLINVIIKDLNEWFYYA